MADEKSREQQFVECLLFCGAKPHHPATLNDLPVEQQMFYIQRTGDYWFQVDLYFLTYVVLRDSIEHDLSRYEHWQQEFSEWQDKYVKDMSNEYH